MSVQREVVRVRPSEQFVKHVMRAIICIGSLMAVGLLLPVGYALNTKDFWTWMERAAGGVLLALAFSFIGGLFGFLFAVPRAVASGDGGSGDTADGGGQTDTFESVEQGEPGIPGVIGAGEAGTATSGAQTRMRTRQDLRWYRSNSNLEDISDWLTTILVGVGLTQLGKMPGHLRRLGEYLAPVMGERPLGNQDGDVSVLASNEQMAIVVVLGYSIGGFLLAYLWTRIRFKPALEEMERSGVGGDRPRDVVRLLGEAGQSRVAELERKLAGIPPDGDERQVVAQQLEEIRTGLESQHGARERSTAIQRATRNAGLLRGARLLWVDDNPESTVALRELLTTLGVQVDMVASTTDALARLRAQRSTPQDYHVIASDIRRGPDARAGIDMVNQLRVAGLMRPVVYYVGIVTADPLPAGAIGITNRPDEFLHLLMDALERVR